jgi:hypothetical protein
MGQVHSLLLHSPDYVYQAVFELWGSHSHVKLILGLAATDFAEQTHESVDVGLVDEAVLDA